MAVLDPTRISARHLERLADLADRFGESPEWVIEQLVTLACVEGWNRYQLEHGPLCPAPFYLRDDGEPYRLEFDDVTGQLVAR